MMHVGGTGEHYESERADDPHDPLGVSLLRRGRAHRASASDLRDLRPQRCELRVAARGVAALGLVGKARIQAARRAAAPEIFSATWISMLPMSVSIGMTRR